MVDVGSGMVAIGAGLAVGLAGLASGWAEKDIGSAAVGAVAENPHVAAPVPRAAPFIVVP